MVGGKALTPTTSSANPAIFGGTVQFQADFWVELEPEGGLFAVTHQVPPRRLRYLKTHAKLMSELKLKYGTFANEPNYTNKYVTDLSHQALDSWSL